MNNVYGTKKPANIKSSDIDIFYHYRPTRNSDDSDFPAFKQLDRSLLSRMEVSGSTNTDLPGIYNLRLPVNIFNKKGFYTIYIKPREIKATLVDVSTLAAYPTVKGIVLDSTKISEENDKFSILTNGSLVGYRVEYFDDEGNRDTDFRIITSSNKCEPVSQNLNDSSQKGIRYRFNESSTLVFCTVTPSVGMSFKANSIPDIGHTSQKVALINTKFNPFMIEVEMVDHDIETISTMLEGDQVRNLDNGLITTFNSDGQIYNQSEFGRITNDDTHIDYKINKSDNIQYNEKDNLENAKR